MTPLPSPLDTLLIIYTVTDRGGRKGARAPPQLVRSSLDGQTRRLLQSIKFFFAPSEVSEFTTDTW